MRRKLTVPLVIVATLAVIWACVWVVKTAVDGMVEQDPNPPVTQTTEPSSSPVTAEDAPLSLFYIALEDKGVSGTEIGCGDSLVKTTTESVSFTDEVEASFKRLLSNHKQYLGESGLYNALYQSRLSYVDSTVEGDTVTVNLTGTLTSGGACDDPRIINQLEQTAMVAADVDEAVVNIDGVPVEERLSAR